MTNEEAVVVVIDALRSHSVDHVVVGSFASNFYGVPRSTQDIDFVVQLGNTSVHDIVKALGPAFQLDPQRGFETVTATQRHVIRLADGSFAIELFYLSEDAHDRERFQRRCRVTLLGRETFLLSVEDVVVTKLRWSGGVGREKDLADLRNVIAVRQDAIDWVYVHRWCDLHGTRKTLDQIRTEIS